MDSRNPPLLTRLWRGFWTIARRLWDGVAAWLSGKDRVLYALPAYNREPTPELAVLAKTHLAEGLRLYAAAEDTAGHPAQEARALGNAEFEKALNINHELSARLVKQAPPESTLDRFFLGIGVMLLLVFAVRGIL